MPIKKAINDQANESAIGSIKQDVKLIDKGKSLYLNCGTKQLEKFTFDSKKPIFICFVNKSKRPNYIYLPLIAAVRYML